MSDLMDHPVLEETEEQDTAADEIVASLERLRATPEDEPVADEIVDEEVASTDTSPEVEAPADIDEQEPTQASQEESEEDRELRWARAIAKELQENPDLGDALVALKQGKASLIPAEVLQAARAYQAELDQPAPEAADPVAEFWNDPEAAYLKQREELESIKAFVNDFQQSRTVEQQRSAQQEHMRRADVMQTTGLEWQAAHPELNEDQVMQVINAVAETNLIRRFLNKHGDERRAIKEAFDAATRLEFPQLSQQQAADEAVRKATRARRAGATAASPRSVPRTQEERPRPRNRAERTAYLADLIREERDAQN